jgi:hypothetical protein
VDVPGVAGARISASILIEEAARVMPSVLKTVLDGAGKGHVLFSVTDKYLRHGHPPIT